MNIRQAYSQIDKQPSRSALLALGATLFGACAAVAACSLWVSHDALRARGLLLAGVCLAAASIVPRLGRLLYIVWLGLGVSLGLIVSPLVLLAIYCLLIVPLGLSMRLWRRDALRRRVDRQAASYWEAYSEPSDPARYLRQF